MMILLLISLSPIGFVKVSNDPTQQIVIGLLTQCIITHGLVLMKASHFDFSKDTIPIFLKMIVLVLESCYTPRNMSFSYIFIFLGKLI